MLEPDSRKLLRELLRPPAGFHFDRAIGTTFTLDLMALLTMPVAFTMFDRSNSDWTSPDPLALLQAIRQHAGRMLIFCQAGQIAVPKRHHLLFAHLEESIVEVIPPENRGIFHPKLTLLRFVSDHSLLPEEHPDHESSEPTVHYRLLCGSRNLTFDRSWDTMLVLEGRRAARRRAGFSQNRPLAQFVEALPELAIRETDPRVSKTCAQLGEELRRVEFDLPDGFEELSFWPLGLHKRREWPFPSDMDQLLVVSPFITDDLLGRFGARNQVPILVSRQDALDERSVKTIERYTPYILHSAAEEPTQQSEAAETIGGTHEADPNESTGVIEELTGLHAKLYVADRGRNTHIWTGSANATGAAFSGNIEFLVELVGPKRQFGVTTLVRQEEDRNDKESKALRFDHLLEAYRRPAEPPEPDQDVREAEKLANQARVKIAQAGLVVEIEAVEDNNEENRFRLLIRPAAPDQHLTLGEQVSARCRPIRLPAHAAASLDDALVNPGAKFGPVSFEAISAFVVFDVEARVGRISHKASFVLNLPLRGIPQDRDQRLLTALLASREQVLRYLLMLLAEDEFDLRSMTEAIRSTTDLGEHDEVATELGLPLLEPLLRTLEYRPERLDEVARIIDDLNRYEQGRALLPPDFTAIWQPIWEARKEMLK